MLASLVNSLLDRFGMRLVRNSRVRPRTGRFQDLPEVRTLIGRIARDPADAAAHADYAALALQHGKGFLAHAQARNAEWLTPTATNSGRVRIAAQALPPLSGLGHNAYHRLQALARILREEGLGPTSTVLDVGGGDGELAAFLSPASYFLADPVANGIAATDLPASIGPFDYVVSCHVLEHVEPAARSAFLDALIERAGDAVVLLNPFHLDAAGEQERLRLVIEITDAEWAKEHLQCSLPHLAEIERYALEQGLECTMQPVGALTTTLAHVFVEFFAGSAGMSSELQRINRFFNETLCEAEYSERYPTGFAVVLRRPRPAVTSLSSST